MIIVRTPLRISFAGGGTDLAEFYKNSPGRVLSATINKYVYTTVTRIPFKKVAVRYSASEEVPHPKHLRHDRVREALLEHNILSNIEIGSFSSLPGQTGLGSSSAFAVGLTKGLRAFLGQHADAETCAKAACRLEIDLLKEPIGKQDQYAAAFGGMNVFEFKQNGEVAIEPLHLDFKGRLDLENHLLLFFTGITRKASVVLTKQREHTKKGRTVRVLQSMAQSVDHHCDALRAQDYKRLGELVHQGWEYKKHWQKMYPLLS